jgi:hypothetical protein
MSRINVANFRHPDGTDDNITLDSSGRVGLGTSSPAAKLDVSGNVQFGDGGGFDMNANGTRWQFSLAGTERMRIDSSGRVGIGTTAPSQLLELNGASNPCLLIKDTTNNVIAYTFADDSVANFGSASAHPVVFRINNTERARIDSSGRLLVGTSTARSNFFNTASSAPQQLQVEGASGNTCSLSSICSVADTSGGRLLLAHQRSGHIGGNTILNSGDQAGYITFQGNDGGEFVECASIEAVVDGTPGANDMPGRLVFSTTADGASNPTERMRIASNGTVGIGQPNNNLVRLALTGQTSDNTAYTFAYYNTSGTTLHYTRNDGVLCTGVASNSPYNLTTGAGANVHVDGNGILYRSTSSIRFKTNIESLEDSYADAILNIEPVWYRSTAPGDEVHPDWSYYGFIAEDVAKIDPRLVFWKTHEAGQDENGTPTFTPLDEPIAEGVQYDRFVPHLLNLIKRQKEQIEAQGAAIAALEARLSALESA